MRWSIQCVCVGVLDEAVNLFSLLVVVSCLCVYGTSDLQSLDLMKEQLKANPDTCGWGGFRVNAVDNRQNTISKRPKFIFVQFMPETGKERGSDSDDVATAVGEHRVVSLILPLLLCCSECHAKG